MIWGNCLTEQNERTIQAFVAGLELSDVGAGRETLSIERDTILSRFLPTEILLADDAAQ